MVGAWVSCLLFTMKQPDALAAFQADTGNTFTPGATPMERMIDEATGHERNDRCPGTPSASASA
jgi:hypothetical protein